MTVFTCKSLLQVTSSGKILVFLKYYPCLFIQYIHMYTSLFIQVFPENSVRHEDYLFTAYSWMMCATGKEKLQS